MKDNPKKGEKKGMDTDASDDTLGENTEQTPLAKEVKKDRRAKKDKNKSSKDG